MIRRRDFVEAVGVGLLAGGTGGMPGCGSDQPDVYRVPHSAMSGLSEDFELDLALLSGAIPTDLEGHVFIAVSAPRGDDAHLFAGEGMTLRLDFGADPVRLTGRINRVPDYYVDRAVVGTSDAFISRGMIRSSPTLGFRGQLNTALLPFARRLLLTIDAGRPYEIDPVTLELVTAVGRRNQWQSAIPGGEAATFPLHLTSAHPVHDPTSGEIFTVNFGLGAEPFLDVLRFDQDFEVERFRVRDDNGTPVGVGQTAHQLALTANHLIVADSSFVVEPGQGFDSEVATPQRPTTDIYLVRRGDLQPGGTAVAARRITLPAEVVHFTADYDDDDGTILLHAAHTPGTDVSEWLRPNDALIGGGTAAPELSGMFPSPIDRSEYATHVIDTTTGLLRSDSSRIASDDRYSWGLALYTHRPTVDGLATPGRFSSLYWSSVGMTANTMSQRIVDLYADHPARRVPFASLPPEGRPSTVSRIDIARAAVADGYELPTGHYLSSPQFIPRPGARSETDGYLLAAVVSDSPRGVSSGDEFWIFDAGRLNDGPVCRLGHRTLDLPFTIHTAWLDTLEPAPRDHALSVREDYASALTDARTRSLFEEEVFPHFPS